MISRNPSDVAATINEEIDRAKRILILSHDNPDGDAISSMLGMYHFLKSRGKHVLPLASSEIPAYAQWLPGIEKVDVYKKGMDLPQCNLVVLVDAASVERTGAIYKDHGALLKEHTLIIIDHHVTNVGEGKVNLIDSESASCAEVVARLIQTLNEPITPDIATCLLLGIHTDTQSFQTSSTNKHTLRTAADLLEAGADGQGIIKRVYHSMPFETAYLIGLALSSLKREGGLIWFHISQEMMRLSGAEDGAYDDVVMLVQRLEDMKVCAMFKEQRNGETKLSLRSYPGINVANIAKIWGGGGHAQAAGATLHMPPAEAEHVVLQELRPLFSAQ